MTPVQEVHLNSQQKIHAMLEEYGTDKSILEVRHLEAIDRILDAESAIVADDLAKRAESKVFTSLLSLWGKGKIRGKVTAESLEKQAKAAEYWASVQEKKLADATTEKERTRAQKYADKQKEKVERLRGEARLLRAARERPVAAAPEAVKPKKTKRLTAKPLKRKRT
jgi:hypothetical protein